MFLRLRSAGASASRAHDDANIMDIHKIVLRQMANCEEHFVFSSLEDAEARRNSRVLMSINGEFASSLTFAVVKERLLIRGRNKAILQIVTRAAYGQHVAFGTGRLIDSRLQCFWDFEHPCRHCGKVFLWDESPRSMCCNDGKFYYGSPLSPISALQYWPPELSRLYYEDNAEFFDSCVEINNRLALSVVSVNHDHDPDPNVDRAFKVFKHNEFSVTMKGGRTYHCQKRHDHENGLTFFITDGDLNLPKGLPVDMISALLAEQKVVNVLLAEILEVWRKDTHLARIATQTQHFDVHVVKNDSSHLRELIVKMRHWGVDGGMRRLSLDDALYEPTSYPLFFPHGEYGWHKGYDMTLYEYTRVRLFQPEYTEDGNIMRFFTTVLRPDGVTKVNTSLPMNRFSTLNNLSQYYSVDQFSRIVDMRLLELRRYGHKYFCMGDKGKNFLPDSFSDSRRSLQTKARNVLELLSVKDRPHQFITLTCNTEWREIREAIPPGASAYRYPEIVARVFKLKLQKFLKNLQAGKYFHGEKIRYRVHVIEYQQRGLPHAHIVIAYEGMPEWTDKEGIRDWIDSPDGICAQKPPRESEESTAEDIRYGRLVNQFMIHECRDTENGCLKNGKCSKHFTSNIVSDFTTFDEKGFPHYKRPNPADLNVVPHNRKILLDWEGHSNVEYAGSTRIILYLFKYLYKGNKRTKYRLFNNEDEVDEHQEFITCRTVSSMSSFYNFLGYENYPSPSPSVVVIKVRSEEFIAENSSNGKLCDLQVYFHRMHELEHLKFAEFYKEYDYSLTPPSANRESAIVRINDKNVYIIKKTDTSSLIRVKMIVWNIGDEWYERLLLLHVPSRSVGELKQFNGINYHTFCHAACARGLVRDYTVITEVLNEALIQYGPRPFRQLFATLTLQGFPTAVALDNEDFRDRLTSDFAETYGSPELAFNYFLIDLQIRLEEENKSLADYGFPSPQNMKTHLERERLRLNVADARRELAQLEAREPATDEQEEFLQYAKQKIDQQNAYSAPVLILIQGSGGTGKTTTLKKILAYVRSKNKLTANCASTAIAASQFNGHDKFHTAHGLFKLPVIEDPDIEDDEPYKSNLDQYPQFFEYLKAASVILWDEIWANSKYHLDEAFAVMNNFLGKVLIIGGDIKQLLSIAEENTYESTFKNCIMSSIHFAKFRKFVFSRNMRLLRNLSPYHTALQNKYLQAIEQVGVGAFNDSVVLANEIDPSDVHTATVGIRDISYFVDDETQASRQNVINYLFPDGFDAKLAVSNVVMATTNKAVDEWNNLIQGINPNDIHHLMADNSFQEVDDHNGFLKGILDTGILKKFDRPNQAPQVLSIKVNDVCFLTRTISRVNNLINNGRVRVLSITNRIVTVQTADNQVHPIPRIKFKFKIAYGHSFYVLRTQFPLRLAYSFTYNKSQSQTLQKCVLDVRKPFFAHGHLYVGLTRVRLYSNCKFFCHPDQIYTDHERNESYARVTVKNIVYKSLINKIIDHL